MTGVKGPVDGAERGGSSRADREPECARSVGDVGVEEPEEPGSAWADEAPDGPAGVAPDSTRVGGRRPNEAGGTGSSRAKRRGPDVD